MNSNHITLRLKYWDIYHSVLLMIGLVFTILFKASALLAILSGISFLNFMIKNKAVFFYIRPFGGYANWVTIGRLSTLLLLAVFYKDLETFTTGVIATIILCLDGLDGFLARKFKSTSEFGGVLDGETDAFFVLLFSVLLYQQGYLNYWVLWPGVLRYVFVIVCYIIWKKVRPEPVSYFRKTIAVLIMASLISPFFIGETYYFPLILLATIAVTYSFGVSFVFQMRNG